MKMHVQSENLDEEYYETDDRAVTLYEGSQGSQSGDELDQLTRELHEYKRKCRELSDENIALKKTIPLLKDAQGKDMAQELKSWIEKLRKTREESEENAAEYHQAMESFAKYKMEMDEKRHETNENYKQVIEKAKREEADNKKLRDQVGQLRDVIAQNGIELESGPNETIRQALHQKHKYMNMNTRVNAHPLASTSRRVPNLFDQQFSPKSQHSCHTALNMPQIPNSEKEETPCVCCFDLCINGDRDSLLYCTMALAIVTLLVVLFIHVFIYFRG